MPAGSKVLDIGAATGILAKGMTGSGLRFFGVEPVKAWAEEAKPYYEELNSAPLEEVPDSFIADKNIIVCADVLEHLQAPELLLKRLVQLQRSGAQFLISVPNVANVWIRINLLVGKFDYVEHGILDRTHLRFFTRKTFLKMLDLAGLTLVEIRYTPIPMNLVHPFFESNFFGQLIHRKMAFLASVWPRMFAYQFVARCQIIERGVQ